MPLYTRRCPAIYLIFQISELREVSLISGRGAWSEGYIQRSAGSCVSLGPIPIKLRGIKATMGAFAGVLSEGLFIDVTGRCEGSTMIGR